MLRCRSDTCRPSCSKYIVLHQVSFPLDIVLSVLVLSDIRIFLHGRPNFFSSEVMTSCKFRSIENPDSN